MGLTAKELSLLAVAEETARCHNCAYMYEDDPASGPDVNDAIRYCVRNPPNAPITVIDDSGFTDNHKIEPWRWPGIDNDRGEYCGEFLDRDAVIAELKAKQGNGAKPAAEASYGNPGIGPGSHIAELELSIRAQNRFEGAGIENVGAVAAYGADAALRLDGFGETTAKEVRDKLTRAGVYAPLWHGPKNRGGD